MKHPEEADLALYAGDDLGFLSKWRVGRHLARCSGCRDAVHAFGSMRLRVAGLNELPAGIGWNRLASEMKANIRLGLEAGECVAGHPALESGSRWPAFTGLHTLLAYAGMIALVVTGVWLQRPAPPVEHDRALMAQENGAARLTADADGIQWTEGDRGLSLRYGTPREGDVNYSADASGAMRARYVDNNTGYVTVVKVNLE